MTTYEQHKRKQAITQAIDACRSLTNAYRCLESRSLTIRMFELQNAATLTYMQSRLDLLTLEIEEARHNAEPEQPA